MHRVRQSVWYFESLGWKPTVVTVHEKHVESALDHVLLQTIPPNLPIIKVKAFSSFWTRKFGLGSLALRSFIFYFFRVNALLKKEQFHLIYFSTTQFPVLILGRYWWWRFGVPYVIDMQDPWHSEFYQNKPKHEQPSKYWFSYRLNKWLEPIAMKKVSGIVAVSQGYCTMLQSRYKNITPQHCTVIPFGAFDKDFEIANRVFKHQSTLKKKNDSDIDIVYVGRGGSDMQVALQILFHAFAKGLAQKPDLFSRIQMHFIGTSYAPSGKGIPSIMPIAMGMGVDEHVWEQTDRMPYFETLNRLQQADILLMPGSTDPNYTASKLYPYILAKKPILAIFSKTSSVVEILEKTSAGAVVRFDAEQLKIEEVSEELLETWKSMLAKIPYETKTNWSAFEPYTALAMTKKQVAFFEKIVNTHTMSFS